VEPRERGQLPLPNRRRDGSDEIDVAGVVVEVAERERAVQVKADQLVAERTTQAIPKLAYHLAGAGDHSRFLSATTVE
jgi:hypothetical protein